MVIFLSKRCNMKKTATSTRQNTYGKMTTVIEDIDPRNESQPVPIARFKMEIKIYGMLMQYSCLFACQGIIRHLQLYSKLSVL